MPNWDKLLIPPVDYSGVKDDRWETAFGRVNNYVDKAEDLKEAKAVSYQQYLRKKMGWDEPTPTASGD